jgi:hypothetical protein
MNKEAGRSRSMLEILTVLLPDTRRSETRFSCVDFDLSSNAVALRAALGAERGKGKRSAELSCHVVLFTGMEPAGLIT